MQLTNELNIIHINPKTTTTMSIAIFSPKLSLYPSSHSQLKSHVTQNPYLYLGPTKKQHYNKVRFLVSVSSVTVVANEILVEEKNVGSSNVCQDVRWVDGTWDLKQFAKDGKTDWDAVIDAEVKRRKWMQDTPQSSSNDEPVVFDTSIVPWWVWMKRFHLLEAELLNGRAAMVGFFMAYFVDSLTGVGIVDQMGNFFCKTLLFVAVAGVLLVRKNEDIETLKKLLEETTFYDNQWQATWQDEKSSSPGKN